MMTDRELDCLVALKVMGWVQTGEYHNGREYWRLPDECRAPRWDTEDDVHSIVPYPYSTDIARAWEVIDRMWELGWEGQLQWYDETGDKERGYRVDFSRINHNEDVHIRFSFSAPQAICLAALQAVGCEVGE